ncbi:MAG: PAS domain-containing protein, partial [Planctomycetota bacterium]
MSGFFLLAKRSRDNALREQDRKIHSVLHSLVDGVVVADDKGEFMLVNRAAERILGGDEPAPAGEWPSSYAWYLPDAKTPYPATRSPLARAIRGEQVPEETVCVRDPEASGATWLRVSGAPLKDGGG